MDAGGQRPARDARSSGGGKGCGAGSLAAQGAGVGVGGEQSRSSQEVREDLPRTLTSPGQEGPCH